MQFPSEAWAAVGGQRAAGSGALNGLGIVNVVDRLPSNGASVPPSVSSSFWMFRMGSVGLVARGLASRPRTASPASNDPGSQTAVITSPGVTPVNVPPLGWPSKVQALPLPCGWSGVRTDDAVPADRPSVAPAGAGATIPVTAASASTPHTAAASTRPRCWKLFIALSFSGRNQTHRVGHVPRAYGDPMMRA